MLNVFRAFDNELISAPFIEEQTGMELFLSNSILDDFESHELIHATNIDEFNGGWQYSLSAKGRKILLTRT